MPLTDLEVRNVKCRGTIQKLSDGAGLQLWVWQDGAKRWRLAFRHAGKQKVLALGVYPTMGLREARASRDTHRKIIAAGRDPSVARKIAKAAEVAASANTFDALAEELLAKKTREGKAERTRAKMDWLLGIARAELGSRPIAQNYRRGSFARPKAG